MSNILHPFMPEGHGNFQYRQVLGPEEGLKTGALRDIRSNLVPLGMDPLAVTVWENPRRDPEGEGALENQSRAEVRSGLSLGEGHLTRAFINLDHLSHNMRLLQAQVGKRPLWPAIKANGYGHGAEIVARHLVETGYGTLCVAHVSEAADLVERGIRARFVILSPGLPEGCETAVGYGFEPVVSTLEQVRGLSEAARKANRTLFVHLKVDTGMGRVGISPSGVRTFLEECSRLSNVSVKALMSHFPRADEEDKSYSRRQIEIFREVMKESGKFNIGLYHFANSAAIFDLPEAHLDAARPGISIYGLRPSSEIQNPRVKELKPVLSWKTRITYLKEVPAGTGLSYGHTFHTDRPSLIATIPLGYGDGMSRLLSNRIEVLVGGTRCRQVGRICMDQCLVDVSPIRGRVGLADEVVIVGRQGSEEVTVDEIAEMLGTINYEVVTAISCRVPRIPVRGDSPWVPGETV